MKRTHFSRIVFAVCAAISLAASGVASPLQAREDQNTASTNVADDAQITKPVVIDTSDGVRFTWKGAVVPNANNNPSAEGWTENDVQSVRLPVVYVSVVLPNGAKVLPTVNTQNPRMWLGGYEPVIKRGGQPEYDEDGFVVAVKEVAEPMPVALPTSPVTALSDNGFRGTRIVVYAITPVWDSNGRGVTTSALDVLIPGARLVKPQDLSWDKPFAQPSARMGISSVSDVFSVSTITTPALNDAALTTSVRITVTDRGIQRVTGADLQAAGFNLASLSLSNAHVFYRGTEVAAQVLDAGTPGVFDTSDEIRFYGYAGDRWNKLEVYWMTFDDTPGLRMSTRNIGSGSSTPRSTAFDVDEWVQRKVYDTHYAGYDGDNLFVVNQVAKLANFSSSVYLTPTLPLVSGNMYMSLKTTTVIYLPAGYMWNVTNGLNESNTTATYFGLGRVTAPITFTTNDPAMTIVLPVPGTANGRQAYLESVTYNRPVSLNFSGSLGAEFVGASGAWRYDVSNANTGVSGGSWLYDISDKMNPLALMAVTSANFSFFDSNSTPYRYLLTGNGAIFKPPLAKHTPSTLNQPLNMKALYVGPASFASAIAPLVNLRASQGWSAAYVDVQAIYDMWSYGRVSPYAIRNFLRHGMTTWSVPPVSIVLVGDSTQDPLNYVNNRTTNIVPTLFASSDLGLDAAGELPCDTCIAQLDGENPLPTSLGLVNVDHLPDVAIGRFPVKTTTELTNIVNKLVGYDTQNIGNAAWRNSVASYTDNYYCTTNPEDTAGCISSGGYKVDPAGNFYAASESTLALLPGWATYGCTYYRPAPPLSPATTDPCYEADPATAKQRIINMYNAGALVAMYNGHGLERAVSVTDNSLKFLLNGDQTLNGVPTPSDIDSMNNGFKLPVVLEMTCFTGRFTQDLKYTTGTYASLDELFLLRPNGGALAVWGPSGADTVYAHDGLAKGFMKALWAAKTQPTLGELTQAGRLEVLQNYSTFKGVLFSYVLLGDPLSRVRKTVGQVYVPSTIRAYAAGW